MLCGAVTLPRFLEISRHRGQAQRAWRGSSDLPLACDGASGRGCKLYWSRVSTFQSASSCRCWRSSPRRELSRSHALLGSPSTLPHRPLSPAAPYCSVGATLRAPESLRPYSVLPEVVPRRSASAQACGRRETTVASERKDRGTSVVYINSYPLDRAHVAKGMRNCFKVREQQKVHTAKTRGARGSARRQSSSFPLCVLSSSSVRRSRS